MIAIGCGMDAAGDKMGGVAVTVCREKAGAHESMRAAKEWLEKNAPGVSTNPPHLIEGAVIIHV